jgi:hypothetical protein
VPGIDRSTGFLTEARYRTGPASTQAHPGNDGPRGDGPRGDGPPGDGPPGDGPRGDGPPDGTVRLTARLGHPVQTGLPAVWVTPLLTEPWVEP